MNVFGRKSRLASIGVTPQELYLIEAPARGKPREEVTTPPRPTIPQQPRKKPETEGRKRWYYWFGDNNVGRAVTAIAAVGIATASTLPIFARNTPGVTNATPNPAATATMTVEDVYRSQVRDYLLQDVPDLADYQSALDYTAQRMVDLKNVYGLSLEQVRAPVTKWVQANIDWDKKGERLVPFTEEIDYIPDAMLQGNFTANPNANAISDVIKKQRIDNPKLAALTSYTDELIAEHDVIWADLHDPAKMEKYLEIASDDNLTSFAWTRDISAKYKNALMRYGTFADRAHLALIGRPDTILIRYSNEELMRNEIPLSMILAVGGKAQISQNVTVAMYKDGTGGPRNDRQLSIGISPQLESVFRNNPSEFGTPLDTGYLIPALPTVESIRGIETYPWGNSPTVTMPLVFRYQPHQRFGELGAVFLVGDANIARQLFY